MSIFACLRLIGRTLLLVLLLWSGPAAAHAQLVETIPADNAVLEQAPNRIVLRFNEPVSPLAVQLVAPDATSRPLTAEGGDTVSVALPEGLSRGTHVLSWRVVSADGHPVSGALVFSIGAISGAATLAAADPAVGILLWASKAGLFAAMLFGIGMAAFAALVRLPPGTRRLARSLSLLGLPLAALSVGLQGLDALGLAPRAIFDAAAWSAGLSTSYGATALAAALAFALAGIALSLPEGRLTSWLGLLAGAGAALSLALSGHASAASPQWLTRPAVFLHIASLLVWIGALPPLARLLRHSDAQATPALARFSRVIPFAVVPLVLSGVSLAVVQMGAPGPQWLTPYGFILAAKLGLLVLLFGLAAHNRFNLTAPALAGETGAQRRLRHSIIAEIAIVLLVLGLVAGWRFTPPPRAIATAPVVAAIAPQSIHLMGGTTMAMVSVAPGGVGANSFDIVLSDMEGNPVTAQSLGVAVSAPDLGIAAIRRPATATASGWRVEGLTIPAAGDWVLELDIRLGRFDLVRLEEAFDVR